MTTNNVEISIKGRWVKVPSVAIEGTTIFVRGRLLKMAYVHDEAWLEAEIPNPELYVRALSKRSNGLRVDIFSFTQKPVSVQPKYDYPHEMDSVAAINLNSFKEWWESLPQETRKNVRRSQKRGVEVRVTPFNDGLIEGIRGVNNDTAVRQGGQNVYFGKSFEQLRKDYFAFVDRSDFICAYVGEELIGFLKLVYRKETASILNLTPKPSHADKRPANALIAKAVELCYAKGVSVITYGLLHYGNKRSGSLLEFKLRNGFEEVLVPRYYVPLTTWGTVCMKAKLHRGVLGILPSRAITMGINLRTKWYNLNTRHAGVAQR